MKKIILMMIALMEGYFSVSAHAQTCSNDAIPESTPTRDFTFHQDGTVAHNTTGLVWKRCLEGQIFSDNSTPDNYLDDVCTYSDDNIGSSSSWLRQLENVQSINANGGFAGQLDWRMPNIKELQSIVEYCRFSPAINTDVFLGWTHYAGSSSPSSEPRSYMVYFGDGRTSDDFRFLSKSVRLVRSGR